MQDSHIKDLYHSNLGVVALAAAFAKTLGQQSPSFLPMLEVELERVYRHLEDSTDEHAEDAMKTVLKLRDFLQLS